MCADEEGLRPRESGPDLVALRTLQVTAVGTEQAGTWALHQGLLGHVPVDRQPVPKGLDGPGCGEGRPPPHPPYPPAHHGPWAGSVSDTPLGGDKRGGVSGVVVSLAS